MCAELIQSLVLAIMRAYLGGVRPTAAPVEFHTPGGPMVAKGPVVSSMVSSTAFFMFDQMYM